MDPRTLGLPERLQRLEQLKAELLRAKCRGSFLAFVTEVIRRQCAAGGPHPFVTDAAYWRGEVLADHHKLIVRTLEQMSAGARPFAGAFDRQIFLGPRGSAKTTLIAVLAAAWLLARYPRDAVLGISHSQPFAEETSTAVQRVAELHGDLLGYVLSSDAKGQWRTSTGGRYYARSRSQGVRGLRARWILVDDPIKSYAEATSEAERKALWDFFQLDLLGCLPAAGGIVALIATAHHRLDLMCQLESAEGWPVMRLSALSEGSEVDPLGREFGVPLCAGAEFGDRMLRDHAECVRHGREWAWSSQWQGRPTAAEGALFKSGKLVIYESLPANWLKTVVVRGWDFAASAGRGDFTCGVKVGQFFDPVLGEDRWVILDVQREQVSPEDALRLLLGTAELDGHAVTQVLPEDPGAAGRFAAEDMVRRLAGHPAEVERITGSKEILARPVAAQVNGGNVGMLRAPWNAALAEELAGFPAGEHDDQVDLLSLAFTRLFPSKLAEWYRL